MSTIWMEQLAGNDADLKAALAEALLPTDDIEDDGRIFFKAFSAGSRPNGEVDPRAVTELETPGYPSTGFSLKSWDVFATPGAPQMDFIFTVCNRTAGETCPVWIGHPIPAHWGGEDPAAVVGSDVEIQRTLAQAARFLKNRIMALVISHPPRSSEWRWRPSCGRSAPWQAQPIPKDKRPDVHV